jgi:PAS domain-containing protein
MINMHERLSLEKEDLTQLINHLDIAVWIINIQNNKAFFSEGFIQVFGRSPKEFYQNDGLWEKTIHPDDHSVVQKRKAEKRRGEVTIESIGLSLPPVRFVGYRIVESPIKIKKGSGVSILELS